MLKENDINFRGLVNDINIGIYVCDLSGKLIYTNHALANILGYERPEDIIGKNLVDYFSPSNKREKSILFNKSLTGIYNSTSITADINKEDGTVAKIEIVSMAFIKSGKLMGGQGVVHDLTQNIQIEEKIMYLSTHDPHSGLYNHAFFKAELKRLERGRQFPVSVIYITVDFLQQDAGALNQEIRDKLIKRFAHSIFKFFRGDDIVARVSDDEFAILLPNVDEDSVDMIVTRIRKDLSEFVSEGGASGFDFYIGVGTAKDGAALQPMLKQAESISHLERKKHKIE